MKRNIKKFIIGSLLTGMTVLNCFTSFAGQWKQDNVGWWWQENNGSYPVCAWKKISDNWYYFESSGYMAANKWIGNYYVGADGAMLVNTVTPDGYKVGADGAWIPDNKIQNKNNQFKFNTMVEKCINASSYEDLITGLQNVRKEDAGSSSSWDDQAYWNQYYRISADNLPFTVEWTYRKKVDLKEGGIWFIPGEKEVSYGLHEIEGTLEQIFDGMTKSSYTVDEFENMLKKIGATNIDSNTSDYDGYFYGAYFHSVNTRTNFQLGSYKCYVNTVDVQDDETVYVPAQTRIRLEKVE